MSIPRELALFPLGTVLFPGMALPLHIFEERYKLMIKECIRDSRPFGVVLVRSGKEVGSGATVYNVGTTAHITQVEQLSDGRMNINTLGYSRFQIHSTQQNKPYMVGTVEEFPLQDTGSVQAKLLGTKVLPMLKNYLNIFATLGNVQMEIDELPNDPMTLAFLTAIILRMPMTDKQRLLDVPDLPGLLQIERKMLSRETHILKLLVENGPRWRDDPKPFSTN